MADASLSRLCQTVCRFKVLLLQGDEPGVLQELTHMIECSDYCNDMLWVSGHLW